MKLAVSIMILVAGLACHAAPAQTTAMASEHHEHKPAERSTNLTVSAPGKTLTFRLTDLQAMPQRSLTVHNGHSQVDETYLGVGLNDLLAKVGVTPEGPGMKTILHSYVRAEGTDKYYVIYSATELEQPLRATDSIIALTVDGRPLKEDGAFKLIEAGETKPARWVRNLSSLRVVTAD